MPPFRRKKTSKSFPVKVCTLDAELEFNLERRQIERNKLAREKQLREAAERERAAMEQRLLQYQEEIRLANEALRRSEETAELLAEKGRVAEEEASLLAQKAADAERENARLRLSAIKTEEEKVHLERKTREAEFLTARLVEESEKRAAEAERLKAELVAAKIAEKNAKEKLLNFLSRNSTGSLPPPSTVPSSLFPSTCSLPAELGVDALPNGTAATPETELNSYQLVPDDSDPHIHRLSLEIEKERVEYLAKSKHLQQQLDELRCEFSVLRVDHTAATLDRLHEAQARAGDNKYSTLKRLKQGSTKTRVAFYEEL
ncbi:merlin-like [Hyposmocoma kahamanoa]|uniref:merlin-like n=1 Tax=Hyposmocoma kahamanoa TaxID=1477025 RepID=UPI000E6D9110|nr:merlin-like [Hyposmocoma kahamanoa]